MDGFFVVSPSVENIVLVVITFIVDDGSILAEDVNSLGITILVVVVFVLVSIVLFIRVVCIAREIEFGELLFARDEKSRLDEASMPAIAGDDFVVLTIILVDVLLYGVTMDGMLFVVAVDFRASVKDKIRDSVVVNNMTSAGKL